MTSASSASALSRGHLAESLPRRWRHVQGVAAQAEAVACLVGDDAEVLVAAAWLHDIGYAQELESTGFHPLDGARFLRSAGVNERIVGLVAHHSCALVEADLRGLAEELASEFPREESATADALWYADLTTGPDGERLTVEERLAEIETRYGTHHVITAFIAKARPEMQEAVGRTKTRLAALFHTR